MEAISHAATSLAIVCDKTEDAGIVLAAERSVASKLLDPRQPHEKIYTISRYVLLA